MEELELLEQAEEEQQEAIALFLGKIGLVSRGFWGKIIDSMDLVGPSETVTPQQARQQNIRNITRYRFGLRYALTEAGYDEAVTGLMDSMRRVTVLIETYYEPLGLTEQGNTFQQAARQSLETIRAALTDYVAEAAFVSPVDEILQRAVLSGGTTADLRRQLRQRLVDSELPTRYVQQQVHDPLWAYHRNYSYSVGEAIGLRHYYYDGVKVAHSREFCIQRKGKAYTKTEIEGWAKLDWQGKIPGTTKESIFWYCGGYNCIDMLRPITKRLYDKFNQTSNN